MDKYKDKFIKALALIVGVLLITALFTPVLISSRVATSKAVPWLMQEVNTDYFQTYKELLICNVIIVSLGAFLWHSRGSSREVKSGILGNARLITNKFEIKRKNVLWDGKGDAPAPSLVFGAIDGNMVGDPAYAHGWVDAKSGCGKTRSIGYASLFWNVKAGASIIFTARKLTEYMLTHRAIERDGIKCFLLDLEQPKRGARFNLMDGVNEKVEDGDTAGAQRAARQLASDFIEDEPQNPFFSKAAQGLFAAIILIVAMDNECPKEQKHLGTVARIIREGLTGCGKDPAAPLKDYIRSFGTNHPAYKAAVSFLQDSDSVAAKNVNSTLTDAIKVLSDEGIEWMLSASDFTFRDLIEKQCVLYPHCLGENDPYNVILSSFYNQLWMKMQEVAGENGERLPHPFVILGDEWGNLPKVSCLGEMVSLGRSMNLRVFIFVQNMTQLNKYNSLAGDNAGVDKILGSMNLQIAMGVMKPDPDGKYFCELAGKKTVLSRNKSRNRFGNLFGRDNVGESLNEHQVDLLPAYGFKDRTPIKSGIIVVKGGENSAPKRHGVFRMPVQDATKIEAVKEYFDLGSEEKDRSVCEREELKLQKRDQRMSNTFESWCPDFSKYETKETQEQAIQQDEVAAWDAI